MKRKLTIVAIISVVGLYFLSMSATTKPKSLGVLDGKLSALPDSPNAVSSQTDDHARLVPSLNFQDVGVEDAIATVVDVIREMPRSRIITQQGNYIHAEFRSFVFRFVDDVEFFVDDENEEIHFRSASRVGHSDLGANRRRMEEMSKRIAERLAERTTGR